MLARQFVTVLVVLCLLHSALAKTKLVCSSRIIGKGDSNYQVRVAGAESLMTIDVVGYFNGANEKDAKIDKPTKRTPNFTRQDRPGNTYLEACMVLPASVSDKPPKPDSPSVFFKEE